MGNSPESAGARGAVFSHVVVNVSDLERSVEFNEAATPLRRDTRTTAPEQSFDSLGVPRGRFDGWLMRDPSRGQGPAVHLVEWQSPKPTGSPYSDFWHLGFFRICFKATDIPTIYKEVLAAGGQPFTEPLIPEAENVTGRPAFSVPDPDGVVLQNITLPGVRRLYHVCLNCSDLPSSLALFETLGLRSWLHGHTDVPVSNHFGGGGELSTYEAALLEGADVYSVDEAPAFSLDLCRWTMPEPVGRPYDSQNNLGIVRIGLAVGDLERVRTDLVDQGIVGVSEPEARDFGPEVGIRTVVIVRDRDGAVIELISRPL